MKTIALEEITDLYRKCGINKVNTDNLRTNVNMGTLNNKLNCDYSFLNKGKVSATVSNNTEKLIGKK